MDEEERALFRHAMRGVRRLGFDGAAATRPRRPRPRARFARAERLAVLQESLGASSSLAPVEESGDALLYRRPHVALAAFRRLRAGQYRVDGGSGAILVLLKEAQRGSRPSTRESGRPS